MNTQYISPELAARKRTRLQLVDVLERQKRTPRAPRPARAPRRKLWDSGDPHFWQSYMKKK